MGHIALRPTSYDLDYPLLLVLVYSNHFSYVLLPVQVIVADYLMALLIG